MEASKSTLPESTSNTSTIEESVLIDECQDFSSPWHFSDLVLVVEDIKFHVHKCILSMWSPTFRTMFSSEFVESTAKEIPLPGKHANEMEVLLKIIYSSGTKQTVTEENYLFLLQLADEYQMDRVKSMCSEFLVNEIEASNCLEYFQLAEKFGLDDVTEKCNQEVCYNSSEDLEDSEHFNGFEPEFKVDICMKVIQELERTLEEYVTTCSDLVQKVYKKIYPAPVYSYRNADPKNLREHINKHGMLKRQLQRALAEKAASKAKSDIDPNSYNNIPFNFSCNYCISRVQELKWNDKDSYSILKEPLDKLYALQQNNKVARKAKVRADRLKEDDDSE